MNFKLALAAAAVVGLAGTAQAADLAKKAPAAADYVKVCDAYGAGFFYIPGTDTCLKIGGYVRFEVRTGNHNLTLGAPGIGLGSKRFENALNTRTRFNLNFDARTNTELGLLRSYIEVWDTMNSGNPALATGLWVRAAFIQFAGLTAGRATSNFDFVQGGYHFGNIEPDSSDHRVNLLSYTFSFGNGISATLGVEDPTTTDDMTLFNIPGSPFRGPYSAVKIPDVVGNIAISQAWGRAQIMGALHQNYSSVVVAGGADTDKLGWVVGAGVEVNLPMLGAGDKVFLQGMYAKGANGYVLINEPAAGWTQDFGIIAGAVTQSKAWSVSGGINHNFSKSVEANLGASYAKYEDWALAAFDFRQYVVGGDVRWKPVTGFYVGLGLDYRAVNYTAPIADGHQWMATLRVQRNF